MVAEDIHEIAKEIAHILSDTAYAMKIHENGIAVIIERKLKEHFIENKIDLVENQNFILGLCNDEPVFICSGTKDQYEDAIKFLQDSIEHRQFTDRECIHKLHFMSGKVGTQLGVKQTLTPFED